MDISNRLFVLMTRSTLEMKVGPMAPNNIIGFTLRGDEAWSSADDLLRAKKSDMDRPIEI